MFFAKSNQRSSVLTLKTKKTFISSWLTEQKNSKPRKMESFQSYEHAIIVGD